MLSTWITGDKTLIKGRDIALFAARVADEKKGEDVVAYDVCGLTDITDYFVIVTAHSKAQVRAICESIALGLKERGLQKLGQEGNESGNWVLLDYADCVIHIFSPELREYYGLESLWGDAPKLKWAGQPASKLKVTAG
jgi:ribosome-associated protein